MLKYLARYTHRVAISNRRLISLDDRRVRFRWKDYASGNKKRIMTLDAVEFLRRFLLHVLPRGFMRIRHYGILANTNRAAKLAACRDALGVPDRAETAPDSVDDHAAVRDGLPQCPACDAGRMITRRLVSAKAVIVWDTS